MIDSQISKPPQLRFDPINLDFIDNFVANNLAKCKNVQLSDTHHTYFVSLDHNYQVHIDTAFRHRNTVVQFKVSISDLTAPNGVKNILIAFQKVLRQAYNAQKKSQDIVTLASWVNLGYALFTHDSYCQVLAYNLATIKDDHRYFEQALYGDDFDHNIFLKAVLAYFDRYEHLYASTINDIVSVLNDRIRQRNSLAKSAVLKVFLTKTLDILIKPDFIIYNSDLNVNEIYQLCQSTNITSIALPLSQLCSVANMVEDRTTNSIKLRLVLLNDNDFVKLIANILDEAPLGIDRTRKGFELIFTNKRKQQDFKNKNWHDLITIDLGKYCSAVETELTGFEQIRFKPEKIEVLITTLKQILAKAEQD